MVKESKVSSSVGFSELYIEEGGIPTHSDFVDSDDKLRSNHFVYADLSQFNSGAGSWARCDFYIIGVVGSLDLLGNETVSYEIIAYSPVM